MSGGSLSRVNISPRYQRGKLSKPAAVATKFCRVPRRLSKPDECWKHNTPLSLARFLSGPEAGPRADDFWSRVATRSPDACWLWTGGSEKGGYGRLKLGRVTVRAHRVAWALANGRDPAEFMVRHRCDNPPCCNPAHLELGTHADNMRDKTQRGRTRTGDQRGERNGHARLTTDQVGAIVAALRQGEPNRSIARRFPVGDDLISRIRTGRSWQIEAAQFGWVPIPGVKREQAA